MNVRLKGLLLGIIAAASYGTNPLFAVPLYKAGLTTDTVLFLRYLIAIPVMGLLILMRKGSFKVSWNQLIVLIIQGGLMALSSLTLFMSYRYMDVGIASTLLFVYPILVAVIMALMFKERTGKLMIASICMATFGITLLMRGGDGATVSLIGTLLVFASALSYAIYIVAINRTSLASVASLTVTFYVLIFGLFLFFGRIVASDGVLFPTLPGWQLWGCVIGLVVFPTVISFTCTNGSIQAIGSTPTAILGAFEPVTAVVIGTFAFGEVLTPRIVSGMILVIIAVVLVIMRQRSN